MAQRSIRDFGRPTKYSDEMLEEARNYLEAFLDDEKYEEMNMKELIPTLPGLVVHLRISRSTLYSWCEDDDKKDFLDIVEGIKEIQHMQLVNGGIGGRYQPQIAKLLLSKHGYSEKVQTDHTSSDGSMAPVKDVKVTVTKEDVKNTLEMLKDKM